MKHQRLFLAGVLSVTVVACPGGLRLDLGNAFPCDFSEPEHLRDQPCVSVHPGEWVCGTDNLCRPNADEGLQSETPDPTVETPVLALPTLLQGPNVLVAADPGVRGQFLVWELGDAGPTLVSSNGTRLDRVSFPGFSGVPDELAMVGVLSGNALLVLRADGGVASGERGLTLAQDGGSFTVSLRPVRDSRLGLTPLTGVEALRVDRRPSPLSPGISPISIVVNDGTAGESVRLTLPPLDPPLSYRPLDAGIAPPIPEEAQENAIADLRVVPRNLLESEPSPLANELFVPVALTRTGFYYRDFRTLDGGTEDHWIALNEEPVLFPNRSVRMRHSRSGAVWAAMVQVAGAQVLSTWLVDRGNPPRMVRAWDECVPCASEALAFTPAASGPTSVEVLCERSGQLPRQLVRITGVSANIDQRTGEFLCAAEPLPAPIELSEILLQPELGLRAMDDTIGDRLTLGGRHGQVWSGASLSELHPLSLDRVPLGLGTFEGAPMAVTDSYVAVPLSQNGMLAVPMSELLGGRATADRLPAASVGGVEGWAILETAELIRVQRSADASVSELDVDFGPQLEGAAGGPASGPFAGEAQVGPSGELRIIATAGDGLYQHLVGTLSGIPGEVVPELPQLTPEPGFPIRSLTLDRATPTRPDAGVKVRGYVVTSRNVFDFQLGGAPERWSQRQVPLPAGEPVEVWMDAPRSPLGRVGYRDGTVYTLPGGYLMAQRLPSADDGGVPRVLDFTNLNGYPVALTERGVFLSRRDPEPFPDGGSSRILIWDRLPLPAELAQRPDRFQRGRIESISQDAGVDPVSGRARTRQVLFLFSAHGYVYRLASSTDG